MIPGLQEKSDQPTRELESEQPFSRLFAVRQPADAATRTDNRIGEVLRAFWEGHFAGPLATRADNCIWRPWWQQELKVWMEPCSLKKTEVSHMLLPNNINIAGFIIVRNQYDLTIQA